MFVNCNSMLSRRLQVVGLLVARALLANCIPPDGGNQECVSERTHRPCIFPFKYQNAMYHECTKAGRSHQPWCATRINRRSKKVTRMEDCDLETCDFEGDMGSEILLGLPVVGCKEDKIHYVGGDFGEVSRQLSWELCKIKCRDTSRCKHWTFRRADGACWLKSALRTKTHGDGYISGPKNCNGASSRCPCMDGFKCDFNRCVDKTSPGYRCSQIDVNPCYDGAECQWGKCVSKTSPNYECSEFNGHHCPPGGQCRFGKCEGGIYSH